MRGAGPAGSALLRGGLLAGLAAGGVWAALYRKERALDDEPTPMALLEADSKVLEAEFADGELPDPAPGLPDIVVVVMDTVRADHLDMYGYPDGTSPQIGAWSAGATVYRRAVADGPWTLPSHGALFTGLSPREHGARGVPPGSAAPASALHPSVATLAERLSAAGYRAAGIAANRAFLNRRWGLDRGFSMWLCEQLPDDPRGYPYVTGDRITALALAWLQMQRAAEPDRPVFLFVNYMDAHSPWRPRAGFTARPERVRRSLLPGGGGFAPAARRLMADRRLEPETQAAWVEAYDAGLRWLDQQVGALLESLPAYGIDGADSVVLTADHGEYLGEHDLVEHSKDLYQEVLHIPLIVAGPRLPGDPGALIQLSDLARHLTAWGGAEPLPGDAGDADLAISELYWSRLKDLQNRHYGRRFNRVRRAFRQEDLVLILGDDGSVEAYDLSIDPQQRRPIAPLPDWAGLLKLRAEGWLQSHPERPVTAPLPETGGDVETERLRALGYLEDGPEEREDR